MSTVVPLPAHFPLSNQKPANSRSYPFGKRPQSAHGQDVAEEGDWPTPPRGGATHATTERVQTATESQARHLEPDYDNEIS